MAGTYTLADLSKLEKDTLRKSVIDGLLMECDLMQFVPWETLGQLSTTIVRYSEIPSIGFRKINEGYAEGSGKTEQISEQISAMGRNIDTDKLIVAAKNTVAEARALRQAQVLKGMAYTFNDKFINGSRVTDPEEFDGISYRIDNMSGQKITASSASGGLNVMADAAGMNTFLDKLDSLIYAIDGHKPSCLLMNSTALLKTRSVLRRLNLLSQTKDMFGRQIDMYGTVPMYDIGVKHDQSTLIIPNTEVGSGGGAAQCTSIYAVKFEVGTQLWGIQTYPLDVTDMGLLEDGVTYRTVVDWPLSLANAGRRSMARLYSLYFS